MHLVDTGTSLLRSLALIALLSAAAAPEAQPAPVFDCNGNGIEDAVDIALGSSGDANRNGVPDECETSW